jgi:hypothetical protein
LPSFLILGGKKMDELTMPRKVIEKQPSKMKNYDEIRKSIHWEEWFIAIKFYCPL